MLKIKSDVCIVTFNRISTDARNFNFIRTFLDFGLSVTAISLNDNIVLPFPEKGFYPIFIDVPNIGRTLPRWREFSKQGTKIANSISTRFVLASDVYSLPIAKKIQRRCKAKLIYDSREIYSALASLEFNRGKQVLLTAFERFFVRTVDNIIVTGELDLEVLGRHFPNKPISIIKNFPSNSQIINPINYRSMLNLPSDSIIIIYQGRLLNCRGIEQVIHALKYNPRFYFMIIGEGEKKDSYIIETLLVGVDKRVFFLGEVPYFELLNWTLGADIGTALIDPISLSYKLALPNKLFEYFKAGIPVVATDLPAIRRVFEKYPFGRLIEPNTHPKEIASALLDVYNNSYEYSEVVREAGHEFSWENQIQTIRELFV